MAAVFALTIAGCNELPPIDDGVCGNGVVDPQEDCDAVGASVTCIAAGQPNACRLTCAAQACPDGWGCDQDKICRLGSGRFRQIGSLESGEGQLSVGDFDGNGAPELMVLGRPDIEGKRGVRLFFLSRAGEVTRQLTLPQLISQPHLGDLTDDKRDDLVFPNETGFSVLAGQSDQSLTPLSYPLLATPVDGSTTALAASARTRRYHFNPAWCAPKPPCCDKNECNDPEKQAQCDLRIGRAQEVCDSYLKLQGPGAEFPDISPLIHLEPSSQLTALFQVAGGEILFSLDNRASLALSSTEQVDLTCQETRNDSFNAFDLLPLGSLSPAEAPELSAGALRRATSRLLVGGADTHSFGGVCDRVFVPMIGTPYVRTLRPCAVVTRKTPNGEEGVVLRNEASEPGPLPLVESVQVPDGLVVHGAMHLAHINDDPYLDLLVGVVAAGTSTEVAQPERFLVAYGTFDGAFTSGDPKGPADGRALTMPPFTELVGATPGAQGEATCSPQGKLLAGPTVEDSICVEPIRQYLAVGDLNGDGIADVVTPSGVLASDPFGLVSGEDFRVTHLPPLPGYQVPGSYTNVARPWREAVLGDFNGDQRLDVAATPLSGLGLDILLATPEGPYNDSTLLTSGQASQLKVGDVDGDHVDDLILKEKGPLPVLDDTALKTKQGTSVDPLEVGDAVVVAFGQQSGHVSEPRRVARAGLIDQLLVAPLASPSLFRNTDLTADIGLVGRSIDEKELRFSVLYGKSGGVPLSSYGLGSPECQLLPLPVRSVAGQFLKDKQIDVATLTLDPSAFTGTEQTDTDQSHSPPGSPLRIWLTEGKGQGNLGQRTLGLGQSGLLFPFQVSSRIDSFKTLLGTPDEQVQQMLGLFVDARMAAGDLDKDGIDELVILAPATSGECFSKALGPDVGQALNFVCHGALVVARPEDNKVGKKRLTMGPPQIFNQAVMLAGDLRLIDLDRDGYLDVVFNTGWPGEATFEAELGAELDSVVGTDPGTAIPTSGRSEIFVFWNNAGTLESSPTPLLKGQPGTSTVRGFALVNIDQTPAPELILTTDEATLAVRQTQGRSFRASTLTDLPSGTSLATGDVDRDGLPDLIIGNGTTAQIFVTRPVR